MELHIDGFGLIEKLAGLVTKKAMRGFTLVRLGVTIRFHFT